MVFTPLKLLGAIVFALLLAGFANRRRPKVHVPLMLAAFAIDIGTVLYLEWSRHAIETALRETSTLLRVHVSLSVATLLLYLHQIVSGAFKLRGRRAVRHREAGYALLATRFGSLVTSFWVT